LQEFVEHGIQDSAFAAKLNQVAAIHSNLKELLNRTILSVGDLSHAQLHPHFRDGSAQQEEGVQKIALLLWHFHNVALKDFRRSGVNDRAVDVPPTYIEIALQVRSH